MDEKIGGSSRLVCIEGLSVKAMLLPDGVISFYLDDWINLGK
mgnify:CR=1 FL=1